MFNQKDKKRRFLVLKYELKRKEYKAISQNLEIPYQIRSEYALKLARLPRNSSSTRIRNRCIITGRSRSIFKKFRISRIVFRTLASNGNLVGIRKLSW